MLKTSRNGDPSEGRELAYEVQYGTPHEVARDVLDANMAVGKDSNMLFIEKACRLIVS